MLAPTVVAPRLVRAPAAVVAPVPPEVKARALMRFKVVMVDEEMVVVARVEMPEITKVPVLTVSAKLAVPVKVGAIENTLRPVPVLSVKAVSRLAEVNEPRTVAFPVLVMAPVRLALVVTLLAVKDVAVPVMLVPTKVDGVPKFGVVKIGFVVYATTPVPDSSERRAASWAEVVKVAERPSELVAI